MSTENEIRSVVEEVLTRVEFEMSAKDLNRVTTLVNDRVKMANAPWQELIVKHGRQIEDSVREIETVRNATAKVDLDAVRKTATETAAETSKAFHNGALSREVAKALKESTGRAIVDGVNAGTHRPLPEVKQVDPCYLADNDASKMIRRAIRQNRHVMVSGPSGSGKTYPVEQELRSAGRRYIKVSVADGLSLADFLCRQDIRSNGKTSETAWRLGFLPFTMENGLALILDEVDQTQPELLSALNAALEYGELFIPQTGQTVKAAPGWQVFMTCNTLRDQTGSYSGFKISAALLNRVVFVKADYLTAIEEKKVLEKSGINSKHADIIALVMIELRKAYATGQITQAPSTRIAVRIGRCMSGLDDEGKKVDDPMEFVEACYFCVMNGMPDTEASIAAKCICAAATVANQ